MGKKLKDQMWDHYINRNHHISDYSLVDAMMLHHDVSYDPTICHIDLYGKVNDEGVYHNFMTGKNMSTLHWYQICKKGEARNDHKLKTWFFDIRNYKIPLHRSLAWKCSLNAVIEKFIQNMMGPKKSPSNKLVIVVMGKCTSLM